MLILGTDYRKPIFYIGVFFKIIPKIACSVI